MQNKEAYRKLCRQVPIPLFMQAWWYDTVCGTANWDVALYRDGKGMIVGAMPYYQYRRWKILIIRMPEVTPFNGIWLNYPSGSKTHSRYSFEREVMENLINQLPSFALFRQYYYYDFANWLPFYWKGFKQTLHYSYVLPDIRDTHKLYLNMKGNARRNIQKAKRQLRIIKEDKPEEFYALNSMTFERQGLKIPHNYSLFFRVNQELQRRNQGAMYFARGQGGVPHAAIYVAWDSNRANVLFTGSDPDLRSSGAIYLLHWHVMNELSGKVMCYDFEGGMLPNVELVYAAMGAVRQPIHIVYKAQNRLYSAISWLLGRPYY